jgi:hypothetical protein
VTRPRPCASCLSFTAPPVTEGPMFRPGEPLGSKPGLCLHLRCLPFFQGSLAGVGGRGGGGFAQEAPPPPRPQRPSPPAPPLARLSCSTGSSDPYCIVKVNNEPIIRYYPHPRPKGGRISLIQEERVRAATPLTPGTSIVS